MKRGQKLKILLCSLLVTTSLAVPLTMMAESPVTPTLAFEGVALNVMPGGDVQLLMTVYVDHARYSDGARFRLNYNSDYLIPSNHQTNKPLVEQGTLNTNDFFQYSNLLYDKPENPFQMTDSEGKPLGTVDTNQKYLSMELWLRRDLEEGHGLEKVDLDEVVGANTYFTFDASQEKVALGTLSFRVATDKLPQIVQRFSAIQDREEPWSSENDYLTAIMSPKVLTAEWNVGVCTENGPGGVHVPANYKSAIVTAQLRYTFHFPKTIISVAAAEPDATVNAYQAYTHGNVGDLAIVMQKYSPMVTATYADGSRSSFLLPWEGCRVTNGIYAATGGEYALEQDFYETKEDGSKVKFPIPVTAGLTVTPVKLTGITADNLTRTWTLGDTLLTQVKNANDLALPREARLLTDVVPGTLSLTMPIPGWTPTMKGSKWPGEEDAMDVLLADESTAESQVHWPTDQDLGRWGSVWAGRRGSYTFAMAAAYGGEQKSFLKEELEMAWPWLTVPEASYELDHAVRRLVGEFNSDDGTVKDPELLDTQLYDVTYVQTVTDSTGHPELTLRVRRKMPGTETTDNMSEGALFRVRLPNGAELGTGINSTGTVGGSVTVPNWFADVGSYGPTRKEESTATHVYDLTTSPGETTGGKAYDAEREVLRRHINLGGWFSVSVNEDPNQYAWTDFIPVYVPPRANLHTESKEYNFVGDNAGLFGWPGGPLGTTVALPRGSYEPVNAAGDPTYETNDAGAATGVRKTEDYGAATTYDGATGAEPGRLYTFTVDGTDDLWPVPGIVDGITTYGPDGFKNRTYSAYGPVQNPDHRTATLRKEGDFPNKEPAEKVVLTYEGDTGVSYEGENVSLVTYDTRTTGYTTRQDYTLVLKNVGDVDVYDLNIDTVTGGGNYVLLDPPASFLPAGASTTFRLSYVYGLKNTGGPSGTEYRNTLYVTSSSHPTSVADDLLDFDARFGVSDTDTHKVTVKVDPADGSMGTAGVVIGEYSRDGGYIMDTTPGTTTFHQGETVYIAVTPEDEYTVKSFVVTDSSGATLTASEYVSGDGTVSGGAELSEGVLVYTFTMPDYDTTVTVTMEEGIYSKLRLSNLEVYADPLKEGFAVNRDLYPVWQKAFTKEEETEAALRGDPRTAAYGQHLMTRGRAALAGFDSRVSQYIVALPYDADFAQVEATLRKVVLGGADAQIKPSVIMRLYPETFAQAGGEGQAILDITAGDTNVPTMFPSSIFDSPAVGKSNYVEIEVQYTETGASVPERRFYYVELHRAPKDPIATAYYGNSPYGMIMNAGNIDGTVKDKDGLTAKDRAKNEFKANGYSFASLAAGYVPEKAAGLTWRYHTEAWVGVDALYEPESHTGLGLYLEENNMDLNDQALFAVLGEPFEDPGVKEALDSTGRPADLSKASLEVKVITLDTAKGEQAQRFAGPDSADETAVTARTVTLTNGSITTDLSAPVTVPADWVGAATVRPGLYQLEYHYPDYDGTSELVVTRPLVLLAPVGDVNADVKAGEAADVEAVLERMTDPLGYTAKDYPAAAIFKFRSCDVNNDRNINNIDANQIRSGIQTKFYYPTGYR